MVAVFALAAPESYLKHFEGKDGHLLGSSDRIEELVCQWLLLCAGGCAVVCRVLCCS